MVVLSGFKRALFPKQKTTSLEKFDKTQNLKNRTPTETYPEKNFHETHQIGTSMPQGSLKKVWDVEKLEGKVLENHSSDRTDQNRLLFSGSIKKHEQKQEPSVGNSYNDYGILESNKRPGVVYRKFNQ